MKKILLSVFSFFTIMTFVHITTYADMNLESEAAVSGMAVALNNYYARSTSPEVALSESVKAAATDTIKLDTEDEILVVEKIVSDILEESPIEDIVTEENATTYGTVIDTQTLRLRADADMDSPTLTLLGEGASYVVTGSEGDYLKIKVDDDLEGYVFKDYIETEVVYESEPTQEEIDASRESAETAKKEADDAIATLEAIKQAETEKETEKTKVLESIKETTKAAETTAKETPIALETTAQSTTEKEVTKSVETSAKETTMSQTTEEKITKAETTKASETIEEAPMRETTSAKETTVAPTTAVPTTIDSTKTIVEATTAASTTTSTTVATTEASTTAASTTVASTGQTGGPGSSSTSSKTSSVIASATRSAVVAYAKQFIGNPYVYGGTSLTDGADCSGFTMQVFANFGYSIGRSSRDQAAKGTEIDVEDVQPGDLLFYASGSYINHVAMYIGDGMVVHASNASTGITTTVANYRTPCKAVTFLD